MTARSILIVDDETASAQALADSLTALGYRVAATASSRAEALELAVIHHPDLVVMNPRLAIEMAQRSDEALRQAIEAERRFFSLSLDLLCFNGFDGVFKRLNPAWERTLGYTLEELSARPFIDFVHPDDRERTLAQNRAVRAGGEARLFENRYRCKDGSYRWLLWNATADVEHQMIYSVARDITGPKQAAHEREVLVRDLQDALAELQTLREILPICSYCRKVRDDKDYWHSVEAYVAKHTATQFSHSICPDCYVTEIEPHI